MKCDYCHNPTPWNQLIELVWTKPSKRLQVCPRCFKMIQEKEIKKNEVSKNDLLKSGLLEQGWTQSDIKSYLQKWTKRQMDTL